MQLPLSYLRLHTNELLVAGHTCTHIHTHTHTLSIQCIGHSQVHMPKVLGLSASSDKPASFCICSIDGHCRGTCTNGTDLKVHKAPQGTHRDLHTHGHMHTHTFTHTQVSHMHSHSTCHMHLNMHGFVGKPPLWFESRAVHTIDSHLRFILQSTCLSRGVCFLSMVQELNKCLHVVCGSVFL